jgi:hypothetical protein
MSKAQVTLKVLEEENRYKYSYSDGKVQVNKGRIGSLAPQYITKEYLGALKKELQNWLEEVNKAIAKMDEE